MGPSDLTNILPNYTPDDKNLLVGLGDDAGIYKLSDEIAIVQTADFITPVVDDPFVYGTIAAANALSDVFTMKAEAKTALALVMHDNKNISNDALKEILRGGVEKIKESGAVLIGGHTVSDIEMKYGLSVTGVVSPRSFWQNSTARVGDKLILTKPLGMGIVTTANKNNKTVDIQTASRFMARLNLYAMRSASVFDVSACTDITGFGLLGHALEMTGCDKSFEIEYDKVPLIRESIALAKEGFVPGGSKANMRFAEPSVEFQLELEEKIVLFDAQTSGGLLLAVHPDSAQACLDAIRIAGDEEAEIIGTVRDRTTKSVVVG